MSARAAMARVVAVLIVVALAWAWNAREAARRNVEASAAPPAIAADLQDPVVRGAYLARLANCRGCHTAYGGEPYAGGRAIPTRFGRFYAPNLTPDPETGLGDWDREAFWSALHEGRGRNGEPLYPVFPYTHYTRLSRADADAIWAYLRSLPPVRRENRAHELRFPYDQRLLLWAWRALFFRPGVQTSAADQSASWNRGAYLVQGLGHCGACHDARNALGAVASRTRPAGGVVLNWYAPALDAGDEAGVATWTEAQVVELLRDGVTAGASTAGPMAEVVYDSLQHARAEDLQAMAAYLRALPDRGAPRAMPAASPGLDERLARGKPIYAQHCADCHGEQGEGSVPRAPALAGNRALQLHTPVNAIRVLLYGAYAPGTAGNPQPYGMPPFHAHLDDEELAAVLSYVRASWGNRARPVQDFEIARERTGPLW